MPTFALGQARAQLVHFPFIDMEAGAFDQRCILVERGRDSRRGLAQLKLGTGEYRVAMGIEYGFRLAHVVDAGQCIGAAQWRGAKFEVSIGDVREEKRLHRVHSTPLADEAQGRQRIAARRREYHRTNDTEWLRQRRYPLRQCIDATRAERRSQVRFAPSCPHCLFGIATVLGLLAKDR